jgi:uncharacterized OB-fold protein
MSAELLGTLPAMTAASKPFWDACQQERLLLPRCETCGRVFYFPRIHCPYCGSRALGWLQASGRGRVFSFTHVALSFHGSAWESQLPYTVILVDLAEGLRMLSRLLGDDREAVRSGDAVKAGNINNKLGRPQC